MASISLDVKSKIAGLNRWVQGMVNWSVAIDVSTKYLTNIVITYMIATHYTRSTASLLNFKNNS